MEDNSRTATPKWYAIHTYSGYEQKVREDIIRIAQQRSMEDRIVEVFVPTEEYEETKAESGKTRSVKRKVFPGYVLVKMIVDDESWYVVRNTRGVTGFVGEGNTPVPLTDDEILEIKHENPPIIDIKVGETVLISNKKQAFDGFTGVVKEIDNANKRVVLSMKMFGKDTPIDVGFEEIRRL